jgi:hypothetical protein
MLHGDYFPTTSYASALADRVQDHAVKANFAWNF